MRTDASSSAARAEGEPASDRLTLAEQDSERHGCASGDGDGGRCELPTTPCSVVWSEGHPFVLEGVGGRSQWAGVDDRGRPRFLTGAELERRGWSLPTY